MMMVMAMTRTTNVYTIAIIIVYTLCVLATITIYTRARTHSPLIYLLKYVYVSYRVEFKTLQKGPEFVFRDTIPYIILDYMKNYRANVWERVKRLIWYCLWLLYRIWVYTRGYFYFIFRDFIFIYFFYFFRRKVIKSEICKGCVVVLQVLVENVKWYVYNVYIAQNSKYINEWRKNRNP